MGAKVMAAENAAVKRPSESKKPSKPAGEMKCTLCGLTACWTEKGALLLPNTTGLIEGDDS